MPSPRRFPPPRTVEQLNDACFDREGQRSADVIQLDDSKLVLSAERQARAAHLHSCRGHAQHPGQHN